MYDPDLGIELGCIIDQEVAEPILQIPEESNLAFTAFKVWCFLRKTNGSLNDVRNYLGELSLKVPAMTTIYKWKCENNWEERLKQWKTENIFLDPDRGEYTFGLPPKNFNVIISHRRGFESFSNAAEKNLPKTIEIFQEKLYRATEALVIPEQMSIGDYSKMVKSFRDIIGAVRELHTLTAEVAGVDMLVQEHLK